MLKVGAILDHKYKILNEVGHGGMSVVYLAINERANKTWAIKEIRKDGVCDFEAVKQGLVVETDMLKRLNHPHLPSIIDVIDLDDSFIIVMDYIEGRSLQSVLKSEGAQPKDLVVQWGIQLCDVLGYLHSREPAIIYRDMKPANVMLKPDGNVTLIDFGTAREFKNRAMVEDTTCLGTRGYAAPEQFGGRGQTDARTDIYCLGATLYHLLTGHSPAEPPYEIKPLSYWDPNYAGSGLEKIINKCCQQDPAARYQTCAELMYDLEHVGDFDETVIRSRKRKWGAFVASVAICLAGVAGIVGFSLAKNNATKATYDFYIQQASLSAANFDEATRNIKLALKSSPERPEAYETLLNLIEADGRLDSKETVAIMECLQAQNGNQTNENALKSANLEAYVKTQFRIGRLHFLMSDNSSSSIKTSGNYFKNATENDGLDPLNKKLAECLYKIASNAESLESAMYTDSEYSYQDLWNDLMDITSQETMSAVARNSYMIALYNKAAYLISENYKNFAGVGIQIGTMRTALADIEDGLNRLSLTENEQVQGVGERQREAKDMVATANKNLNSFEANQNRSGG